MSGPGWLAGLLAVVMLGTAAYCAGRLLAAWRSGRPTGYAVDLTHVLMGTAMAGMLVPRLSFGPAGVWRVVFAVSAFWFAGQGARGLARRRSARGEPEPSAGPAGHAVTGHALTGPFVHVLACAAMLVMLAGPAGGASAPVAMAAPGGGTLPLLAVVCAVGLLASAVLATDRLATLARVPAGARPLTLGDAGLGGAGVGGAGLGGGAGRGKAPMSLRLAACCDIAVGVTMGYLLVLMIG